MPVSSPDNVPISPYANAPYNLHENWCLGDSRSVINANTDYFESKKVNRSGDTMTGRLIIESDIFIRNGGVLDLNCGKLLNFGVDIKSINIPALAGSSTNKYVLQSPGDCGKILKISADTHSVIAVPKGLPVGFNVMILCWTNFNMFVAPDPATTGVFVRNVNNKFSLAGRYGICNLVIVEDNVALISGDLT